MKLCEYGCGVEDKNQLKNGKWCCNKRWNSCLCVRKKRGLRLKGRTQSEETKQKRSKSMQEKVPWNKGIKTGPLSKEHKKKISKSTTGKNKGKIPWNKGIKTGSQTEEHKKKSGKAIKLTIEKINKKYPTFSKVEGMRYNLDKSNEKEIQVRCKNHNCKNSKERGGWFTPEYYAFRSRINAVEKLDGNDGSYFYCCQECKDTCPLYRLKSDPLKETNLPYTHSEWSETRGRAWERDNGICQDCGKPGTDVHHIKPVKLEPFLALDIDNLITLCEDCHKRYHKKGNENSTRNLANITCSPESQKFLNQK